MNVIVPAGYFDPYEDWEGEESISPVPTGATRIARIPISTFNGWEDLEETLLAFGPNDLGQINIPLDRTMASSITNDRPLLERSAREMERELLSENYQPWPNATRIVTIDWPNRITVIKFRVTHFRTTSSTRTPARVGKAVGPLTRSLMRSSQHIARNGSMDDLNRQLTRLKDPRYRPRPRRNPGDNAVSSKEALETDAYNFKLGKAALRAGKIGAWVLPNLPALLTYGAIIWFFMDRDSFIEALKWVWDKVYEGAIKPAWSAVTDAADKALEKAADKFGGMSVIAVAGGLILVGVVMMQRK